MTGSPGRVEQHVGAPLEQGHQSDGQHRDGQAQQEMGQLVAQRWLQEDAQLEANPL